MTLFELIRKISTILTPATDWFYGYVLRCAEDGGLTLRLHPSGGEWPGERPIQDKEIGPVERAVVAFRRPFREGEEVPFQLFYRYNDLWTTELCATWSLRHRYPEVYVLDLNAMTCELLDPAQPLKTSGTQPAMTLYGLIGKISAILTPETNSFYDYVLRSSDDNGGLLRTRFCLWDAPAFWNREIPPLEEAVVCFRDPFQEDYGSGTDRVKLQLFYLYGNGRKERDSWISWSRHTPGWRVPYLFDFRTMTYRILEH